MTEPSWRTWRHKQNLSNMHGAFRDTRLTDPLWTDLGWMDQEATWQSTNNYVRLNFYQPSCWLYSVPNLLVFQQLVTPYLGEILVRVVSEIIWKTAQECARKTGTCDKILRVTRGCKLPKTAHVPGMPEVETSR